MKIKLQSKQSVVGDTFPNILVTVAFLGVVVTFLYAVFSAGFPVVQSARENLGTAQIVMQKAEALRLFTRSQVRDASNHRAPLFVEPSDPQGARGNRGSGQYAGYLSAAAPAAGDLASASPTHPHTVTVTLCSTNADGAKPVVHQRGIQVRLARNGMPKYIWGTL